MRFYSIHPVGLPVLAVPAFAAGGYRGVVWLVILLAAGTAALLWRWAFALTGSLPAATFAWAAVGLSAPFVFSSGTVYPEIPAGFCVMVAAGLLGPVRADAGRVAGVRLWLAGLAVAALPWLSTKYAGMALVLAAALALRERARPRRAASIVLPLAVSLAGWFTFFYAYWGSPLPSAPYGDDTQMSVRTLLSGGPGNWLDQEFGVLIYAPVLALGFAGLAGLGRDRAWRAFAVELALVLAAMCAMVGSFGIWWGGSAMPGRPVISILPLLAAPIARHYELAIAHTGRVAASRLALLISLVTTAALAIVAGGRLLAQGRDGSSAWLEWLSPVWHLWASAPTFIFSPPLTASGQALCWLGGALIVAALCRRGVSAFVEPGRAARRATLAAAVVSIAIAAVVPAISSAGAPGRFDPEARSFFPMLGRFDAVARPLGVRYDPLSMVPPSAIPPLFTLTAVPGQRLAPQPLEVMLNARFMLPAGEYELELTGVRGQGLPEGRNRPADRPGGRSDRAVAFGDAGRPAVPTSFPRAAGRRIRRIPGAARGGARDRRPHAHADRGGGRGTPRGGRHRAVGAAARRGDGVLPRQQRVPRARGVLGPWRIHDRGDVHEGPGGRSRSRPGRAHGREPQPHPDFDALLGRTDRPGPLRDPNRRRAVSIGGPVRVGPHHQPRRLRARRTRTGQHRHAPAGMLGGDWQRSGVRGTRWHA